MRQADNMATRRTSRPVVAAWILFAVASLLATANATKQTYIVYTGASSSSMAPEAISASHHELLSRSGIDGESALLYSYTHVFNGFSAHMYPEEAALLAGKQEVVSLFPSKTNHVHTTHSWAFLGLEHTNYAIPSTSLWRTAKFGADIIIGLLDTGIWPESQSFSDVGIGPIPAKWKGSCVTGQAFSPKNCNRYITKSSERRKLIGAKYYIKGYLALVGPINSTFPDYLSPRDSNGHGSHTASTAGGGFVPGANELGQANGTAKGGAPHARIAAYKVCWAPTAASGGGCTDADILAAMDAAVHDGVDIVSISLGSDPPLPPLYLDSIALGTFHANQKGIVTACSAGNAGPTPGTVSNIAPWDITVAASTIDRSFPSNAILGNKKVYHGQSSTNEKLPAKFFPLVSAADVGLPGAGNLSILCLNGTLDPAKVKGKIVACLRGVNGRIEKGVIVKVAGGIGMILGNAAVNGDEIDGDPHFLPATQLVYKDAVAMFAYIASTSSPVAQITPAITVLGVKPAPTMAAYSSQGPNTLTPDLLKPDITAPGVSILAAWSGADSPSELALDTRRVKYNIISGTSMSCPHTSGTSALLKAAHPHWSPAAIKSALVTSATVRDNNNHLITNGSFITATPFNYGGGQIHPDAAANPGLIYDATTEDYLVFLCSLGYNSSVIYAFTEKTFACPEKVPSVSDLNYPSIAVGALTGVTTIKRTVTNVGPAKISYKVVVQEPYGVHVSINPPELHFTHKGEQKSFLVILTPVKVTGQFEFGYYVWTDGHIHHVRSPVAVLAS